MNTSETRKVSVNYLIQFFGYMQGEPKQTASTTQCLPGQDLVYTRPGSATRRCDLIELNDLTSNILIGLPGCVVAETIR